MESPISKFRKRIGLSPQMMAAELMLTDARYNFIEAGAMETLLPTICVLANEQLGPGEGAKLAAEYQEYRASMSPEAIKAAETGLWPAGKACGMV